MRVPHETGSAAAVRHQLRDELATQGVASDSIDVAVLVASELVANAVRHTVDSDGHGLHVDWALDTDGVTLGVTDCSDTQPVLRHVGPDELSGRGLLIIDALSADWGVRTLDRGKHVWARLPVLRPAIG
jgi:anti-sigma regulatory factor (Ser/Thr protein kinase)